MAASSELGTRVPRKAKSILDRLVASKAMTKEGMEWLISATDPFHDDRVRCPGYPDMSTVNSVVQTYNTTQSFQITGASAPWDLHCFFEPFSNSSMSPLTGASNAIASANHYSSRGYYQDSSNTPVNLYPGWNVVTDTLAGDDWLKPSGTVVNYPALALPPKYCSGHYRLIGTAVEAVNTTADLYKGGSITVYRAPSARETTTTLSYVTSTSTALATTTATAGVANSNEKRLSRNEIPMATFVQIPLTLDSVALPPTSQAEAAIYTDSRTWAAEDGCYVIATQNSEENNFLDTSPSDIAVMKVYDSQTLRSNANSGLNVPIWTTSSNAPFSYGTVPATEQRGSGCKVFPFDTCGFVMSGLNQNSTIQLTVKYFVERIPATSEPDLLSMAQVPPAYDSMAIEIYSRCLAEMPVGVPVNENPLGEWFNSILDTIKSVAPKLGNIVSGVGRAIGEIGGSSPVQSNATPERKQSKQQKQQSQQKARKSGPMMQNGKFTKNKGKKGKKKNKH
jgi:hypothetical protein